MKNIIKIAVAMPLALLAVGCSDAWLDEQPPHLITAESLYSTADGFEMGLNGLYSLVRDERVGTSTYEGDYMRGEVFLNGVDNMCTNHRDGWGRVAEYWDSYNNAENTYNEEVFEWLYEVINAANTIVNRAEDAEDIDWSEATQNRVIGEARAVRAWAYRHLTYTWGAVPLTLDESLSSNIKTDWERTPASEVREFMIEDFLFAEEYVDDEPIAGRISKGAVLTYLAETYLVLGRAQEAYDAANRCIDNSAYSLITERYGVEKSSTDGSAFSDMFVDGNSNRSEGNTEALWVFQFEKDVTGGSHSNMRRMHGSRYYSIQMSNSAGSNIYPLEMTTERGGRGMGRMSITKWAMDLYDENDDRFCDRIVRKSYTLKDETQNDTGATDRLPDGYEFGDVIYLDWSEALTNDTRERVNWPYSRKYDYADPNGDMTSSFSYNDQVYLRLADTYLLRAEAELMLGKTADAAATINILRDRANADQVTSADIDLDFILDERSRELFLEEHRRHTLLRYGGEKWYERTKACNFNGGHNIVLRDTILPIPQSVIDCNLTVAMEQNPGY